MESIMKIGGCDMIGSNHVKRFVKEKWNVFVVDNLWRGKFEYSNNEIDKRVIGLDVYFFNADSIDYDHAKEIKKMMEYVVYLTDIVYDYMYRLSSKRKYR